MAFSKIELKEFKYNLIFLGAGLHVEGGGGGAQAGFICNNPYPLIFHPRALHDQPIYGYTGDFQLVLSKF